MSWADNFLHTFYSLQIAQLPVKQLLLMMRGGKKTGFDASQACSSVYVNTHRYLRGSKTRERYFEESLGLCSGRCSGCLFPACLLAATAPSDFGKRLSLVWLFVSGFCPELTLFWTAQHCPSSCISKETGEERDWSPWCAGREPKRRRNDPHGSRSQEWGTDKGCLTLCHGSFQNQGCQSLQQRPHPLGQLSHSTGPAFSQHWTSLLTALVGCTWCCTVQGKRCNIVLVEQTWLHGNGRKLPNMGTNIWFGRSSGSSRWKTSISDL